jgi:hypothetical protein
VKAKLLLPILLMLVFALTRWPGLLPWNFSAVYGLVFCAGVYFPKRLAWWLPLVTMMITDLLLNWYYHTHFNTPWFSPELIGNYAAYVALIWLGRRFSPKASFLALLGGGVLGAILFYLVTNTLAWFVNPFHAVEYTKDFVGWLIALTRGTENYPYPIKMQTWELFRNTLTSGGLFTGLFVGAMKLMGAAESKEEKDAEEKPQEPVEEQPEEAKA